MQRRIFQSQNIFTYLQYTYQNRTEPRRTEHETEPFFKNSNRKPNLFPNGSDVWETDQNIIRKNEIANKNRQSVWNHFGVSFCRFFKKKQIFTLCLFFGDLTLAFLHGNRFTDRKLPFQLVLLTLDTISRLLRCKLDLIPQIVSTIYQKKNLW